MEYLSFAWTYSFILLCSCAKFSSSDIYDAMEKIEKLFETERFFLSNIEEIVKIHNENIQQVKRLYKDISSGVKHYETHMDAINKGETRYLVHPGLHPSSSLEITHRYAKFWKAVTASTEIPDVVIEILEKLIKMTQLEDNTPTSQDLFGIYVAIVRLIETYQLNYKKLAKGVIYDLKPAIPMTMDECRNLGLLYLSKEKHAEGIKWFELAKTKTNNTLMVNHLELIIRLSNRSKAIFAEENPTVEKKSEKVISDELEEEDFYNSYEEERDDEPYVDYVDTRLLWESSEKLLAENNDDNDGRDDAEEGVEVLLRNPDFDLKTLNRIHRYHKEFAALCRVEHKVPIGKFTCHLKKSSIRYNYWKVEQISETPPLWIYHDFVDEKDVALLQSIHKEKSTRAKTGQYKSHQSEHRVGTIHFLGENYLNEMISLRITDAIGLDSLKYAESLQTSHYGLAGHYDPHFDCSAHFNNARLDGSFMGDRRATFMIYLNEVTRGGSTVFPKADIAIKPIKGAAVMWYNLDPFTEKIIPESVHGGCPVLIGSKWVANKWIHNNVSRFEPEDYFEALQLQDTFNG